MNFKNAFGYFFYKLYKFGNENDGVQLRRWKTILVIGVLEIWTVAPLMFYYRPITGRIFHTNTLFAKLILAFFVIFILIFNYYYLDRKNMWKHFITVYDELPLAKKRKYNWVFRAVIAFILGNFILSIYIMSKDPNNSRNRQLKSLPNYSKPK